MDVAQSAGIELPHFLSLSTGHLGKETMTWIYSAALQFDNMNSWLFVGLSHCDSDVAVADTRIPFCLSR